MSEQSPLKRITAFLRTPRGIITGLWMAYFFYWAAPATYLPYVGLYYETIGLNGAQIGQLASIRSFASFTSSILLAFLSDYLRRRKLILVICIIGVTAAMVAFPYALSFTTLLPIIMLYSICLAPTNAILDENTLRVLDNPRDYSKVRVGGSYGWGLLVLFTGWLLDRPGVELTIIFPLHIFFLSFLLILVLILPESGLSEKPTAGKVSSRDVWDMLKQPYFALWLFVVFLWGLAESSLINFLPLHIKGLGGSTSLMGISMAITILGEIAGFALAKRVQDRIGARRMMAYAFLLRLIWFVIIPFITNPVFILPFDILGGASFALIQSGGVSYFNRRAPRSIGTTAQAIRGAVLLGLGTGSGALINGTLYQAVGSANMFRIMSLVSSGALVLAIALRAAERRWEKQNV